MSRRSGHVVSYRLQSAELHVIESSRFMALSGLMTQHIYIPRAFLL